MTGGAAVRVASTQDELARDAAVHASRVMAEALATRGAATVMLATGNSQLAFLEVLAELGGVDWSAVTGFHMDEYVGIGMEHPASFARYMRDRVVQTTGIGTFHYIDGTANPQEECDRYARLLRANPPDLCCLGIGENGHLAFNDPPVADLDDPLDVKVVALDDACKRQQVGEGHFATPQQVPPEAISVTIPALLRPPTVIVVCPERRKAPAVQRALEGPIGTACPASILQRSPQATVYLDRESASMLSAER
ncbi:MAG TPA: glucosamine-6-phosphate deaminase [Acidimicrobiia bacterium]|jgi:glucosamine-6-phosphate deaminase